jgi:hypothetical protein
MLLSVEKWALRVGLKINADKTEYLLSGDWSDLRNRKKEFSIKLSSGKVLKEVEDFKYLGSWLVSSMNDFKVRLASAWSAITKLNKIWRSNFLEDSTKINLFNTLIISIYLYNATTWTVNKTLANKIDSGYNKLLRYALNIRWKKGVKQPSNKEIYNKHKIKPISTILKHRRQKFIGHCFRSALPGPDSAPQPISDVLFLELKGTKKRGNRSNYRKIIYLESESPNLITMQNNMLDREKWRFLVSKLK